MNEFKINKFLKLRLENGKTVIFVDDKEVIQCKYLLLNLTPKDFEKFDEIESIDEAFEIYNNQEDRQNEHLKTILSPEEEFVGHCSNLQTWVENRYDPNLLHSNLSFPLLKKLTSKGDNLAKIRLKEVFQPYRSLPNDRR